MNQQHPQQQQTETTTSIGYSLRPRKQKQAARDTQQQQRPTRPNRNNVNFNDNNFNDDHDDDDDDGVESDDGSQQKKAKREATNQLNKNNKNYNNNKWWQSGFLKYYSFHEVPRYMQDNEDIHGHYRAFYSYKENWISLFHLHNESVNVWNHLIGGFISIVWGLCALYGITIRTLNLADPMDRIMILLHCLASAFTFFTSGLYHLHLSHSYEAYNWWGCWDYAGISAQIGGATVALLYYLFYCETGLRTMWATLVLCFSSVGVIGPYFTVFNILEEH